MFAPLRRSGHGLSPVPSGERSGVECGALAYAKAHVTAGTALVKRFRLALRSPQELKFSGTLEDWLLAETHSIENKISNHKGC